MRREATDTSMGRRPQGFTRQDQGNMSSVSRKARPFFSNRGIIAAILIAFFVSPAASAGSCLDHISTIDGPPIQGISPTMDISKDMSETTAQDTVLYTVSLDEDVPFSIKPGETNFDEYFKVTQDKLNWTVAVKASLKTLPDYSPSSVTLLSTVWTFDPFSDASGCTLNLKHTLLDENTQNPTPANDNYALDVREDYPTGVTFCDFKIDVTDNDFANPNNQFSVTVKDCPLMATDTVYTSSGGNPAPVQFNLLSQLDFETLTAYTCTVVFEDIGTPPRSTTATIDITVTDEADEPPVFSQTYYYSEVFDLTASNTPIVISPEVILAIDGDLAINSTITYKMENARTDVNGLNYFTMDPDTAEVKVTKDLDDAILDFERISFIVTAEDDTGASSCTCVLEVALPPVPTTTPTTAGTFPPETTEAVTCPDVTCPDVTCPECTCPTTQFTTEGTCAPCPTTQSTTEGTCAPCLTTQSTTECTCAPCPTTQSTTEGTCTPCPTTQSTTEGTCTPCPTTQSTTEGTCTPCPTTQSTTEGTCTPCPTTQSTTEGTCIPCPSVSESICATQDTCEPCPSSDATTEDPTCSTCPECPTTCPIVTCPTGTPPMPSLSFTKDSYAGTIYATYTDVLRVAVVEDLEDVVFSWEDGENSDFSINSITGEIKTLRHDYIPKVYSLVAVATSGQFTDHAQVNIEVLAPSGDVTLDNSLVEVHVTEGQQGVTNETLAIFTTTPLAGSVCITEVVPEAATGKFKVMLVEDVWVLRQLEPVDYEEMDEVRLRLLALKYVDACPMQPPPINQELLRNEGLVIITVDDVDDKSPVFVIPPSDEVIAYPQDAALQKVVGPVITLQAVDSDTEVVQYVLEGESAAKFGVSEVSGAVFLEGDFSCSSGCQFTAKALDEERSASVAITVLELRMDHIFTLTLVVLDVSEISQTLEELSTTTGTKLTELYVSPNVAVSSISSRRRRSRQAAGRVDTLSVQVHVYSMKDGKLMDLTQLNEALADTETEAQAFIDQDVFSSGGGSTDLTGWKAAVGVLGALLGLVLIAGVGFFVYRRRQGGKGQQGQAGSPISTLGRVYPNQGFTGDINVLDDKMEGNDTSKTNGSLNGGVGKSSSRYTAPPLITTSGRDSPPLYRSALSHKPEPASSSSRSDQRVLRRTEPGSPEYYGTSTPAPPPSFTRTTTTTASSTVATSPPPVSFSTSASTSKPASSSGLYPTIVTIAPTSQTQVRDQKGTQDFPLTSFSSSVKIKEPAADYETILDEPVSTSKFGGLKGSPPPKRSAAHREFDDEDTKDGVFYPGSKGKKDDGETTEDEEKKSVAFKVLVDTKEIQAENLGPSQKKAAKAAANSDALDILEANKNKMGDDDDEGNVKL